jgi:hypothetical protein
MNMPGPRLALRLVARGAAFGVREELIGDVLEEIAGGRSRVWVCQQVIGLYGFALMARVRDRARLTPPAIALAMSVVLVVAASIAPARAVLAAWLGFYYLMGTLSLFAHMASHTIGAQPGAQPRTSGDSDHLHA